MSQKLLACSGLLLALFLCTGCGLGHADALWKIVHGQCVSDQQEHGNPAPCVSVNLAQSEAAGVAVLKDRNGPYQYLVMPTARIPGIESGLVYAAEATNYFSAAWEARRFVEAKVGHPLPRDTVSLAINSRFARSQDQLHIHVDCLKPTVHDALVAQLPAIGDGWAPLSVELGGHHFAARRVHDADLGHTNPFLLLPDAVRADPDERGRHTLVVVGATFGPGDDGFVVLDGRASWIPFDAGHGEDLQDHACH